jgi:class 3 adenylate cyclase/tetratricopeptide (TPR) repeat protein
MRCPTCGHENREGAKFCDECGKSFHSPQLSEASPVGQTVTAFTPEPERKVVTALFSDLSGYTALTERLDPEQVKEITGEVFVGVKQIISRYEGFVDRLLGDGVLAFFGIPKAHEDDPVRAIQAALEIHEFVKGLSPRYEGIIGGTLSMHSGINTGLVVTAEVDPDKGSQGVAGDAVNLAARLSGLAGAGEILVGEETVRRTKGRFEFQDLGSKSVKGKAEPVVLFKLTSVKAQSPGLDRQVSSAMVGRDQELDRLELQVKKVVNGEGSVVHISGEAGIGKSRLLAELRRREVMKKVTLLEGRAISIGRNLSFHPIIDLLKQWAGISEEDSEAATFDKLDRTIRTIHPEEAEEILPFVATLMGLKLQGKYAERVQGIEGEALEKLIFKNMRELFIRGSEQTPTVIVMEDLHWADRSSLLLLQSLYRLAENRRMLFINLFRPGYWLGEDRSMEKIGELLPHHFIEIPIQPLDRQAGETLIGNLLDIRGLPDSLRRQIIERSGGNPFFIEEVVRSLIDEGAITRSGAAYEVTEKINAVVVPPTINDVLIARIDRLDEPTRNLLKIASVIGRNFFYRILREVAASIEDLDDRLVYLKDLQLIRDRRRLEELEYLFKHALAQEAVYQSLLKNVRLELHERVGSVMERLFEDRQNEFCETIAFHFKNGRTPDRAIPYLIQAGEKSIYRFAIDEAYGYYREAYDLLENKPDKKREEERFLIDLLIQWGTVFYYRGGFSDYEVLLESHELLAVSLDNKHQLGMFYAWLGWAKFWRAKQKESCIFLERALKIGSENQDHRVMGYACCWMAFSCFELGLLKKAETLAEKALSLARHLPIDQYLSSKPYTALGFVHWFGGAPKKVLLDARHLLEHGKRFENIRSRVMGYCIAGVGHFTNGDIPLAIENFHMAAETTEDPLYKHYAICGISLGNSANRQFDLAKVAAQAVIDYSNWAGTEVLGTFSVIPHSVALIMEGHMGQGFNQLKALIQSLWIEERKPLYAIAEHALGRIYLQIILKEENLSVTTMVRNIGFLIKNVPWAAKKAEEHFHKALATAREVGMKGVMGQAYLDLGILHRAKRRTAKARECLTLAIECFEECEAETYLRKAREMAASLK